MFVANATDAKSKNIVCGKKKVMQLEQNERKMQLFFTFFFIRLIIFFLLYFLFIAVHQNYVGIDAEKNPYFLSIVSQDSGNKCTPVYRAMLFRRQVNSATENWL